LRTVVPPSITAQRGKLQTLAKEKPHSRASDTDSSTIVPPPQLDCHTGTCFPNYTPPIHFLKVKRKKRRKKKMRRKKRLPQTPF
jgi:hypothetical protein